MEVGQVKQVMMPAAWVSVMSMVAWIIGDVTGMVNGGAGSGWAVLHHPWAVVATALLVGLAVVWAGAGRSARWLTIAALCVTVLFTIDAVVLAVLRIVGVSTAGIPVAGEAIGWIGSLALSVMAVVGLLRLLPLTTAHPDHEPALPELPQDSQDSRAPTWEVDQAAGAHWQTAGAAAAGAAAHDRGRPGEPGGWTAALGRSREAAPGALLGGATPPSGSTPAPIREPQAFGPDGRVTDRPEPRRGEPARVRPDAGAPDDDSGVSPGGAAVGDYPAGRMPTGQASGATDPRALGQQYAATAGRGSPTGAATAEDAIDSATPGTRRPPRWTPLDRDQPPRPGQ